MKDLDYFTNRLKFWIFLSNCPIWLIYWFSWHSDRCPFGNSVITSEWKYAAFNNRSENQLWKCSCPLFLIWNVKIKSLLVLYYVMWAIKASVWFIRDFEAHQINLFPLRSLAMEVAALSSQTIQFYKMKTLMKQQLYSH